MVALPHTVTKIKIRISSLRTTIPYSAHAQLRNGSTDLSALGGFLRCQILRSGNPANLRNDAENIRNVGTEIPAGIRFLPDQVTRRCRVPVQSVPHKEEGAPRVAHKELYHICFNFNFTATLESPVCIVL
jgi:hypothetical protein